MEILVCKFNDYYFAIPGNFIIQQILCAFDLIFTIRQTSRLYYYENKRIKAYKFSVF